jgi:hypothetical protein
MKGSLVTPNTAGMESTANTQHSDSTKDVHNICTHREELPQAENGENVGGINNEGVLGDPKDGGYGVNCEHEVAELHARQHQQQRRRPPRSVHLQRRIIREQTGSKCVNRVHHRR